MPLQNQVASSFLLGFNFVSYENALLTNFEQVSLSAGVSGPTKEYISPWASIAFTSSVVSTPGPALKANETSASN
ncbi:hypothetical protein [Brevibacillus sp. FIR094]|uniref:hypothetical protein n=1 Tax=Brevibacillus sp. FIR094 TaxID=3134809 RepID=UPI003D22D795